MTAHGSDEDVHIGQVVHVMREGMLGVPGGEYTLEASAENPAVLLQLFEQEESGFWEATNLYTGCMMSLMVPINPLPQEPEGSEVAMAMYDSSVGKRDYSTAARERMAEENTAMPDGSFPIANATDLRNAIQSVGRAKDYNAAKQHIMRRARALGMIDALPEDWKNSARKGMTGWENTVFDLNPFVK